MSDSESRKAGNGQTTDFQDRSIACVDCGEHFVWTAGEQVFFHDKGLKNEPKRCKPCKQAKNDRLSHIRVPGLRNQATNRSDCGVRPMRSTNHRAFLSIAGPASLLPLLLFSRASDDGTA